MFRRFRRVLLVAVAFLPALAGAEDSGDRLAPIAEDAGRRVDPMRPVRLSASERERLYEQAARDAAPLERQAMQLRRLAELVRPTVVHIDATKPLLRPRGGRTTESETGSGVIVHVAGRTVVITNRHVVHRAPLHGIVLRTDDGRELLPVRTRSDASSDIAVLEVEDADLQPARTAGTDSVGIGDTVIAVGSPFGLSHSLTLGIVSATGRRALELGDGTAVRFQDFIQTDAAINPGNSGGPLINLRGEVVGLTTAIATDSGVNDGVGFAIPISMVMFVARQLVEHGSVARGYLGVSLDKDFTALEAHRLGMVRPVGARVEAVTPGAPAEQVGVLPDDVVLEFAGKPVQDDDHLMSLVSVTPIDSRVDVVLFRAGERVTLTITVASRRDFETP